jgi:hypothetical protein
MPRHRWVLVGLVALLFAVPAVVDPVAAATSPSCPAPPQPENPSNPAYYAYVNSYDSRCSATQNWDRSFPDTTISTTVDGTVPVSVTTSTALGGAVASLTVAGKQYIASGGHGTSLQYAFHAWNGSSASGSECYNPTQAGARIDDSGHSAPWHGPSTSALYQMSASGQSIQTASRPAMFITLADHGTGADPSAPSGTCVASTYQPNTSPYNLGLSPYWLTTGVQLNPLAGLNNVIELTAALTSADTLYQNFDAVLIAYLQPDFTNNYQVDPVNGTVSPLKPTDTSATPTERCTGDDAYCLGIYARHNVEPSAYYYLLTRGATAQNGGFGEYTTQITVPTTNVGQGSVLSYETYLVVGNKRRVADTIAQLASQLH